jgi:tRNA(fMet)-specific endonuclease VapC
MYVLDTNTLVYYFKGMGNVAYKFLKHAPSEIAVPTIVIYEIEVGVAKSTSPKKRSLQLKDFASSICILPFGSNEATASAKIRAKLEKKGRTIGPYDILIAGTALANNGTLVTHNVSEFNRVDNLRIEDWY